MALAPATWSRLVEDGRTQAIIEPFVGFFDLGGLASNENPEDIDDVLDAEAALIPRMILILRKLARIREAAGHPALPRRGKIGRNNPCPCGFRTEIQTLLRSRVTVRSRSMPWGLKAAYDPTQRPAEPSRQTLPTANQAAPAQKPQAA